MGMALSAQQDPEHVAAAVSNHGATSRCQCPRGRGAGVAVLQDAHVVLQALWRCCPPVPLVAQH